MIQHHCGGKPGKPGAIRKMTWSEDPPVWVGYCKGCADCDPDGSFRRDTRDKAERKEEAIRSAEDAALEAVKGGAASERQEFFRELCRWIEQRRRSRELDVRNRHERQWR